MAFDLKAWRERARQVRVERRSGRIAAAVIVGLWIALGWLALYLMAR